MAPVQVGREDKGQGIGAREFAGLWFDAGQLAGGGAIAAVENLVLIESDGRALAVLFDVGREIGEIGGVRSPEGTGSP
jgi:hypothetical protein